MKKFKISNKPVIFKSSKNTISLNVIKGVFNKIHDNKKIPIVFETKKQYLQEYMKNQEKAKHVKFPKQQKEQYLRSELQNMQGINSRYTTKTNPYIKPEIVFFTDRKTTPKQFEENAMHEHGHEIYESNKNIRNKWNKVNTQTSPSVYGTSDKEEDFAESYSFKKTHEIQDPNPSTSVSELNKRMEILKDVKSKSYLYLAKGGDYKKNKIARVRIDNPDDVYISDWKKADKWPVEAVAGILTHEQLHSTLQKDVDLETGNVFAPNLTEYNPYTGETKKLREYKDVVPYIKDIDNIEVLEDKDIKPDINGKNKKDDEYKELRSSGLMKNPIPSKVLELDNKYGYNQKYDEDVHEENIEDKYMPFWDNINWVIMGPDFKVKKEFGTFRTKDDACKIVNKLNHPEQYR